MMGKHGALIAVPSMPAALGLTVLTLGLALSGLLAMAFEGLAWMQWIGLWGASTGFLLLAVACGAWQTMPGFFLLLGLVGCFLGDLFGPGDFALGGVFFLIGHLFFIAGFAVRPTDRAGLLLGASLMSAVAVAVVWWITPHLEPAQKPLSYAYTAVICAMVATAAGAWRNPGGRIALVAAVIFFISDLFVARWQYVGGGRTNAFFCYPLYYTACVLFAWSAFPTALARRRHPAASNAPAPNMCQGVDAGEEIR